MATLVEYVDNSDSETIFSRKTIEVGFLHVEPPIALTKLISTHYVVDYQGIKIPSKSQNDNANDGLKLSLIPKGYGTLSMSNQNKLFRKCERSSYSPFIDTTRDHIVNIMKSRIRKDRQYLTFYHAEKVSEIFDVLGCPMKP